MKWFVLLLLLASLAMCQTVTDTETKRSSPVDFTKKPDTNIHNDWVIVTAVPDIRIAGTCEDNISTFKKYLTDEGYDRIENGKTGSFGREYYVVGYKISVTGGPLLVYSIFCWYSRPIEVSGVLAGGGYKFTGYKYLKKTD